jgi:hypothetical protein
LVCTNAETDTDTDTRHKTKGSRLKTRTCANAYTCSTGTAVIVLPDCTMVNVQPKPMSIRATSEGKEW